MTKKTYKKSYPVKKAKVRAPKIIIKGDLLYGLHAAIEALKNPVRKIDAIYVTEKLWYGDTRAKTTGLIETLDISNLPDPKIIEKDELDYNFGKNVVHQGLAIDAKPLEETFLSDLIIKSKTREKSVILMLDQVTDPHNIGAIIRSAAAFGVLGIIGQTRHMPDYISPVCAKIASGGVEHVPIAREVNLSDTLKKLLKAGFTCIGLDERGEATLSQTPKTDKVVIVLGAEGTGLRPKIAETCTYLARLPTQPPIESLNVSNAAAIALYDTCLE